MKIITSTNFIIYHLNYIKKNPTLCYKMNFWYGILSSLGFIFILNNYFVFNIKNSLGGDIMSGNYLNNKVLWGFYKMYAVGKRKTSNAITIIKSKINTKRLNKNLLLIKDGVREQIIRVNNKPISNYLPDNVGDYDLIIYRTPSQKKDIDYDLVRVMPNKLITDDSISENDTENRIDCSTLVNCYDGKVYSPLVRVAINENVERDYELELDSDNYYIEGNIIFDTPFVKWIIKEKYDESLPESGYTITYLDEDMNESKLNDKDYLLITKKGIEKIQYKCEKGENDSDTNNEENKSSWGLW